MKLYYFEFNGRAEAIRLLLTHAGAKFEDVRIPFTEWPKYKEQFELKQVPVLEVDGKRYCQTYAILEYLGAKFGYLPKSHDEIYRVLYLMNTAEDVFQKAFMAASPRSPFDEKGKAELLQKLFEVEGPIYMKAIEKKLKENSTQDFMVGKSYTIVDFFLLGAFQNVMQNPEWKKLFGDRIEKKYPLLFEYANKRLKDFNLYYKKCQTKLYYFDMPGRGEMVRILLKKLNIPFEDIKIKFEDWAKEKTSGKFELQQLPVLKCEPCGIDICQTDAIMHRLGAKKGFLPMNCPEKLYKVLWWCSTMKDIMENCSRFFAPIPEDKKKVMRVEFFEKTMPVLFGAMENRLKLNDTLNFLVGENYTLADFYLVGVWRGFIQSPMFPEFATITPKYPILQAYFETQNKLL